MRVLVVEDEPHMADVVRRGLTEHGFAVDVAETGVDGAWRATENDYDTIVLDIMLPDIDGFAVLEQLRAAECWAPVLMLTARDAVTDRVRGLDGGADDYLTKPFAFDELLARLRALSRRVPGPRPTRLVVGDLTLDPATRIVRRGATRIVLTAKEYGVLECLMRRPGQVHSRTELIEHVWDVAFDADSNVVDVYIGYLRRKVDRPFGRNSIETVRGMGYRISDGDRASQDPA